MKKVYMALIPLFVAVSFLSASYHSNMTEEEAFLDANASFDKQDFDAARKSYSDFTDKFPQSKHRADALIRLAETAPSIEEADRIYHSVIADYAGAEPEARARAGLGKMYYAAGDYIKARGYFEAVVQKFPDAAPAEESYYYTALCIYAAKDYDALDSIIDSYIKKNFSAYKGRMQLLRAEELYAREKYQDAAAVYRQVIDAADTKEKNIYMPAVYFKLSDSLKKSGDTGGADIVISSLKEKFPLSVEAKGTTAGVWAAPSAEKPAQGASYSVQVGAYTNKKFCDYWEKKLGKDSFEVNVKKEGKFFKLTAGKFATKQEAQKLNEELLAREKIKGYIIKSAE